MKHSAHFFLGVNSAEGFYSLYDQLITPQLHDLLILKGCPGCGKSSFMRHIADALQERGQNCISIHCSGDPDSLDAVIFPALHTAIVDGTAPHVSVPEAHGHILFSCNRESNMVDCSRRSANIVQYGVRFVKPFILAHVILSFCKFLNN